MSRTLLIAILGAGKMAVQHAAAIRTLPNAKLIAVVDPNVASSEITGLFGEDISAYSDATSMLASSRPDVVHIVTPPETHASLAKQCLDAEAHVYVEKPFSLNVSDARDVLDIANRKGLKVCAAHQVLHQEAARRYKNFLPLIGSVRHVESFFSFKPVRRRTGGVPNTPVAQLLDILPHPVYLLLDALPMAGSARVTAMDLSTDGEVRAVVRRGNALGCLTVSLQARPIESFLRVMGTNGSVTADFVLGYTCRSLGPGASAPAVVVKPFSQALQTAWGSATSLTKLVFRRHKSYPGLAELLGRFYASITDDLPSPTPASDILQTVEICETIGRALATAEQREDELCQKLLDERTPRVVSRHARPGICVLTGGTGILGRQTAATLCESGWRVRVPVRRPLRPAEKIPGVEYLPCDLADSIPDELLRDADIVVHAAAETAGTRADHERNTIQATGNLLDAMKKSCCKRLINISSVAVLKPSRRGSALSESSPVDLDNPARGPYVWAKAAAESAASRAAEAGALQLRTVRLGPLVDFDDYTPPGRLGREVARLFVAMGNPGALLPVCSVSTAAGVIGHVAGNFGSAPPVVNLLEVPEPTRRDLTARLLSSRPDLRVMWIPFPVLRVLSLCLKVLLKLRNPRGKPLDLYAAFKSERYETRLAESVIREATENAGRG